MTKHLNYEREMEIFIFISRLLAYFERVDRWQKKVEYLITPPQFTTNVIEYLINNSFSEFKFREFYCNF